MKAMWKKVFWTQLKFVAVLIILVSVFFSGTLEKDAQALDLPPPLIATITPNSAEQGQTLDLIISGMHFINGANVSFAPPTGINGTAVTVVSPMELNVTITVTNNAPVGTKDVTVTNPDGQNGTLIGGFTITEAPTPPTTPPVSPTPTALSATPTPLSATPTPSIAGVTNGTNLTASSNTTMSGGVGGAPVYIIVILVALCLALIAVLVLIFRVKRPAAKAGSSGKKNPPRPPPSNTKIDQQGPPIGGTPSAK